MTTLMSCPFCGGEARLYSTESRQSYRRAVVKCKSCGAELRREGGGFPDFPGVCDEFEKRRLSNERAKAEAAEAWNTRAATTIGRVQVEVEPTERTCTMLRLTDYTCQYMHRYACSECGEFNEQPTVMGKSEPPRYCPSCGACVVGVDE